LTNGHTADSEGDSVRKFLPSTKPAGAKVGFVTTAEAFRSITDSLQADRPSYALAELNDLLTPASADEIRSLPCPSIADPYLANYVAAMVEYAAHRSETHPPAWTSHIAVLDRPVFAAPWLSLRAHLLLESPPPFRRRNIFIDSSLGARV
jgi:hypothetical protein